MKNYEIKTVNVVTQEQIDDIMATAIEGGITHWCDKAATNVDKEKNWLSDMLTRAERLELHVADEDKWVILELNKLLNVLGEMQFNFDDYDAMDVDNAIQKAVFGEVVYG